MRYMLDTTICIFIIKQKPESVIQRLMELKPGDICISSITYAELVHGAERSQAKEKNRLALTIFLSEIPILPFDDLAAQAYGRVKAELQREGVSISQPDTLIAAHAKSKELTLVSNHIRDFARVDGLIVEDWG